MNLYRDELLTFVLVAENGSLSKAASKLFLSKTAVMNHINNLEDSLRTQLFDRNNKGFLLTSEGEMFYHEAKHIIRSCDDAAEKVRALSNAHHKVIHIGASILNSGSDFISMWLRIKNQIPEFKINLVAFEDDREQMINIMMDLGSKYDIIVGPNDSKRYNSVCKFHKLWTLRKMIAVPLDHHLSGKSYLELSDLHGETIVMSKYGDTPIVDEIHKMFEMFHPGVNIEETGYFYDLDNFNYCASTGKLLLISECYRNVHPDLVSIPVNWKYEAPYGIFYANNPSDKVKLFLKQLSSV